MTELALTLFRFGFLVLLWFFVLFTIAALRRDMLAPSAIEAAAGASAPAPKRPARQSRSRARNLVVVDGSLKGTVLPLGTSTVTIGRAADCTLVVDDDYASSHHARLYQSEGHWIIEDTGSTNGTWIDRTRITGPTLIELGTPLRIGRTAFELRK
ncbi:MAG: FHA domain-containing protein [Actinomycetes bacterium]